MSELSREERFALWARRFDALQPWLEARGYKKHGEVAWSKNWETRRGGIDVRITRRWSPFIVCSHAIRPKDIGKFREALNELEDLGREAEARIPSTG